MLVSGPALDSPVALLGYYADLAEKFTFSEDIGAHDGMAGVSRRWVEREAAGVVAGIVAYNYPMQLSLVKLAPALAAGRTVVLKGAPHAPLLAAALGALIATETDIPPRLLHVPPPHAPAAGAPPPTHPPPPT